MGRKSVREDKSAWQLAREAALLTREAAEEEMVFVSDDRVEKIESGRSEPHPDEVLAMAKAYRAPDLVNHYCSHVCPIGRERVPEIPQKELPSIVLALLADMNALHEMKDRLIEIAADGRIRPEEAEDFSAIRGKLSSVSLSAAALDLWVEKEMLRGDMEK